MIRAIVTDVDAAAAERAVRDASPGWAVHIERHLYYPFHWFHLRYSTRTLLGRSRLRVSCLVDARSRVCATSDAFELQTIDPSRADVLEARVDENEALAIAERYGGYVMRSRRRAFIAPEVEPLERALVHKPYWVARCADDDDASARVLIDGLTARFHPLPQSLDVAESA